MAEIPAPKEEWYEQLAGVVVRDRAGGPRRYWLAGPSGDLIRDGGYCADDFLGQGGVVARETAGGSGVPGALAQLDPGAGGFGLRLVLGGQESSLSAVDGCLLGEADRGVEDAYVGTQ